MDNEKRQTIMELIEKKIEPQLISFILRKNHNMAFKNGSLPKCFSKCNASACQRRIKDCLNPESLLENFRCRIIAENLQQPK